MSVSHRLKSIGLVAGLTTALLLTLFAVLGQTATAVSNTTPSQPAILTHLDQGKRLHWLIDSTHNHTTTYAAPDENWNGNGDVINGTYTATQAYSLRMEEVALFRTTVQDDNQQDIGTADLGYFERIFNDLWNNRLNHAVLTETQISTATLANYDILILPTFKLGYTNQVADALGVEGREALLQFIQDGGLVYAQGQGQYLLEAIGAVPTGTVDVNTPLELPASANDLGQLLIETPANPLTFNWDSDELLVLSDPTLSITAPLQAIATYTNTLSGEQTAIAHGRVGLGQVILVSGQPTDPRYGEQLGILFNSLLLGMSEKADFYGRAAQTYTTTVPFDTIPAYEANIPISVTLNYEHLWQGTTLENTRVTERVTDGFVVDMASISPAPLAVEITNTYGVTETIIIWDLGDTEKGELTLTYVASTTLAGFEPATYTFSRGWVSYTDDGRPVTLAHKNFRLKVLAAADIKAGFDAEADRFYTIPAEGIYRVEDVWLENVQNSPAYNTIVTRTIPLIVPIVDLEDQREPLATNAGETVYMANNIFVYEEDFLPLGMSSITETWGMEMWDGQTVVTMTTPGGYHIDPILASNTPGFFVTIPATYTHAITVTAAHELVLPALTVTWDLNQIPPFWYEAPIIRYGIHSHELFSRPVSFTGDPFVDTVVVDAIGGSVYTSLGDDPRVYRDQLADLEIHPPQAPVVGLSYDDIWGRTHTETLRATFYDVFNFASCGCGPGGSERSAAMNVTFAIYVDADGDGVRETMLTEFDLRKGIMPTRLVGDLDIVIKSRNLGRLIQYEENVLDLGVFRGIGYRITPRNGTWGDSYTSDYSTLEITERDGGYDHLLFRQAVPPNATEIITVHATLEPTSEALEGIMPLHQGVRFVYRQEYAGDLQYEMHDTHVQANVGMRSDAQIQARALPSLISTYSDTLFLNYPLDDLRDFRDFAEREAYIESWGYGDAAATTYVGGRDQRTIYYSLITLGDKTWVRVELNNNTGLVWENLGISLDVPAGITATRIFTDDVPVSLWPDIPSLNLTEIPDAAFGIYYFEIQTDEAATALLGQVLRIPVIVTADNLPANFEAPPATVGIRTAVGKAPRHTYDFAQNLTITDTLPSYVDVRDVRIATQAQMDEIRDAVNADTSVIPNTNTAEALYYALPEVYSYTVDANGQLLIDLGEETVPWRTADGEESNLHVLVYSDVAVNRATRYPANEVATLDFFDSFGLNWQDTAGTQYINASGAAIETSYEVLTITNLATGSTEPYLTLNEWNEVVLQLSTANDGVETATDVVAEVTLTNQFSITHAGPSVTATVAGLRWNVAANLAAGSPPRTTEVTLRVFATDPNVVYRALSDTIIGDLLAVERTDAGFTNVYSGEYIEAQTGDTLAIPVGYEGTTPPPANCFAQIEGQSTVFASESVSALQAAVNVAPSGATIKVAGVCAGLSSEHGGNKSVFIGKNLTLRGGYDGTDWVNVNPFVNETVLDAQMLGRVVEIGGGVTVQLENLIIQNGRGESGAGIYAPTSGISLTNVLLRDHIATENGGGIFAEAATLYDVQLENNTAVQGGGAYILGTADLQRTSWQNNSSALYGTGDMTVVNALFANNSGTDILAVGETLTMWHTTIVNETTPRQTAIHLQSGTAELVNSIITGHDTAVVADEGTTLVSRFNLYHDNTTHWTGNINSQASDLFNLDPQFAQDAPIRFRTSGNSPAVDSGEDVGVTEDLLGNPRPSLENPLVDRGAYEQQNMAIHAFSTAVYTTTEGDEERTVNLVTVIRQGNLGIETAVAVQTPIETVTVTFGVSETVKQVPLTVMGDTIPEPDETLALALVGFEGQEMTGEPDTAVLVLLNDDYNIYLPLITHLYMPPAPDLMVTELIVTGEQVAVTIKNEGNASTSAPFWVDVYLNPQTPPTAVNEIWEQSGGDGLAWGVAATLAPDESLTLTLDSPAYDPSRSRFVSLPAGTAVYAQVDSLNNETTFGAVQEMDERQNSAYNNITSGLSQ